VELTAAGRRFLPHAIDWLRDNPTQFACFGLDWPVPADAGIRVVPLDPAPCYLWSLVWREADQHPLLPVLEGAIRKGQNEGWLAFGPERDWLPDPDLDDLRRSDAEGG
jgi:hypothetical protein